MNIERKIKRPLSIKTKITLPFTIMFTIFIIVIFSITYFININSSIQENNKNLNLVSQQVLSNYETYFQSVIDVSENIQKKLENYDEDNYQQINEYFKNINDMKKEINSITLFSLEGKALASDEELIDVSVNEQWFQTALQEKLINIFSSINVSSNDYYFTLSKYINYSSKEGIIKIEYDFTQIVNSIASTDLGEGGHITIIDKYDNIIYTSLENNADIEKEIISSLVIGEEECSLNDNNFYLYINNIRNTSWRSAIFINNNYIKETIHLYTYILSAICIAFALIILILNNIIAKQISLPIIKLQKEMMNISSLNYKIEDLTINQKCSKEVLYLQQTYIEMIERIQNLMIDLVKKQNEQRKSELKALQNQINPHFLYNTLDSIVYLIDKNENEKAQKMIIALSKFFRISISRGRTVIPLFDEIEHAKNYLIIQKLRYEDKFNFTFNVDDNLKKYYVIKLILQPIIENAIIHGFVDNDNFQIDIKAYLDNDLIKFEIKDNGFGILEKKIQKIYQSFDDEKSFNGVGLKNVYQRLKIYYGEKANLLIESELDVGTKIIIMIPLQGAEKNEE